MGWIAYVLAWTVATLFWAVASASGAGISPVQTLPYAVLAMGSASSMGVGVWKLTERVPLDWRSAGFLTAHGLSLAIFCAIYATSWIWLDIARGEWARVAAELPRSPVLIWNLLMGSWLYLMIAGLSYAVRAQRKARATEAAVAEARLLAQQAQLTALRAQINPHFLFNALHSVGALVTSDPVLADRALEQLGDLLRYALHADDEVPLRSELAFTRDYLAFEQLRLDDRLKVVERIEERADAVRVPPLILQPLVENAVRHGIADRPDGGIIEIAARVEGGRCVLSVTDDGRGPAGGSTGGLGLASVRRRLTALYGEAASVSAMPVRPTEPGGTPAGFRVTISLPTRGTYREDDGE